MRFPFAASLVLPLAVAGCSTGAPPAPIPNYAAVDAAKRIFRGGQPTKEGWASLWAAGVTNVVKLNSESEGSDDEALIIGMTVYEFPISVGQQLEGGPPLSLLTNAVNVMRQGNCFVHCGSDARTRSEIDRMTNTQGGQDRTGLACYAYRVWVDGWTDQRAYVEAESFKFHAMLKGLSDCREKIKAGLN